MKRFFLILAACIAWAGAIYYAGDIGADRVEQALSLKCARASDGTDQSIADCYTSHGQPVPEDF